MRIRPMLEADVEAAMAISADAFDFDVSDPHTNARWRQRMALRTPGTLRPYLPSPPFA